MTTKICTFTVFFPHIVCIIAGLFPLCVHVFSVAVVENGWCELSPKLLVSNEARQWEKSLGLMERLLSRCDFAMHLGRLEELKAVMHLREAASEDDGMDYAQLLTTINRVTSHIRAANKEL